MRKLFTLITTLSLSLYAWSQQCTVSTYPYVEDFDGSAWNVPFGLDTCWTETPVADGTAWGWHLYTGNSNINGRTTGVTSDVSGSGNYLFAYSDPSTTAGTTCEIVSPTFDLTSLLNPSLEFAYHMYGTAMGTLRVEAKAGTGSWTVIDSIVGQQQTSSSDPWNYRMVSLASFSSANTQIRLVGISGGVRFAGDINIDEFKVFEDTSSACGMPTAFQLVGTPTNSATFTWIQKSIDSCEIQYGPTGFNLGSGISQIGYGDSITILGLTTAVTYDAYVRHFCNNDTSYYVGPITFTTRCGTVQAPYYTDFSMDNYGRPASQATGGYAWNNCWTQPSLTTQTYWVTDTAGGPYTTRTTTGPDFDNTNYPNTGGGFMVLNSSGSVVADLAYSPRIDISSLQEPALTFAYHMYGADVARLRVDIWDGSTWTNGIWSAQGEQQSSGSDPWRTARISLANYAGSNVIQLRFHAPGSTSGLDSDIAIDDVTVDEASNCAPIASATITNTGGSSFEFDASSSSNLGNVSWVFGDGNTGQGTIVNHTYSSFGTYNAQCIIRNGCGSDTLTQTVQVISVNEYSAVSQLTVYPNPASQIVYLELNSKESQVVNLELITMDGRVAFRNQQSVIQGDNSIELNIGELPAGAYTLRLTSDRDFVNTPLIVK